MLIKFNHQELATIVELLEAAGKTKINTSQQSKTGDCGAYKIDDEGITIEITPELVIDLVKTYSKLTLKAIPLMAAIVKFCDEFITELQTTSEAFIKKWNVI